jgi:hypothetical protein
MDVLNVRNQRDLWLLKDHHNFKKLKNFFKNVFVRIKPSGRKKQIRDLQEFAGKYKFNKDNGQTTVEVRTLHCFQVTRLIWTIYLQRHFNEVYNISLRQPKMFGIATRSKERKFMYPAELCIAEAGQFYRKEVPSELTKSRVYFATKTLKSGLTSTTTG